MSKIKLTKEQHEIALKHSEEIHMLTNDQIDKMVEKLLTEIKIPFLSEEKETIILAKTIRKVDMFIYKHLPTEIYECVHLAEDGILNEDAEIITERLIEIAVKYVHLPFITAEKEALLLKIIIDSIVIAIKQNSSL